jgi:Na+/H+-dicarboxylate symporter
MWAFLSKFKVILLVLATIVLATTLNDVIPLPWKSFSYSISNSMRAILVFMLPLLIFPFMTTSIMAMKSKGAYLVVGIMLLVTFSNFISIMIPYFVSQVTIPHLGIGQMPRISGVEALQPMFVLALNPIMNIESTMALALISGLILGHYSNPTIERLLERYTYAAQFFFQYIFIPALPIYVFGTIVKAAHEASLGQLIPVFGSVIMVIIATQLLYISFLFFLGAGCSFAKALSAIKNALPAGIIGFSTMSSIVTMPVTLKAAEKNIEDQTIARIAISTTVNCHDVGECISLPLLALTLYYIAYASFPSASIYIPFAFMAAVAQFSGVSVPGGSIVVLLPFLSHHLNFTAEMCSMLIVLSICMDPIGTANNVLGNSAFAMIIDRILRLLARFKRFCKATTSRAIR